MRIRFKTREKYQFEIGDSVDIISGAAIGTTDTITYRYYSELHMPKYSLERKGTFTYNESQLVLNKSEIRDRKLESLGICN